MQGLEAIHLIICIDTVDGDDRCVAHIFLLFTFLRTKLVEIFYSRKHVDTISAIRVIATLIGVTACWQETRNFATGNKQI